MQVFVGITRILLTLGVARLRAQHRSVGLQAWSVAVAIVGGLALRPLLQRAIRGVEAKEARDEESGEQ